MPTGAAGAEIIHDDAAMARRRDPHLDRHLVELLARYDLWIHALLFLIIFAETGLVVTPFCRVIRCCSAVVRCQWSTAAALHLPGCRCPCGRCDRGQHTQLPHRATPGPRAFDGQHRRSSEHPAPRRGLFRRHGGFAIVLSRFVPVVRTFTPPWRHKPDAGGSLPALQHRGRDLPVTLFPCGDSCSAIFPW
jgi:hypothetical protein